MAQGGFNGLGGGFLGRKLVFFLPKHLGNSI